MKTHISFVLFFILFIFSMGIFPVKATEKDSSEEKKPVASKSDTVKVKADSGKVKTSNAFLNRWKKIQSVTKKKAYETQKARTVAGVRGAEAEDSILEQLYFKGGVRYPSRVDMKNAISQLQDAIKSDPSAEGVPEMKLFVAQCHSQLGEVKEATAVYNEIIKNHAETEWSTQAKIELDKLSN